MIPLLENPCTDCCLACKKYPKVKDMKKNCESRKERSRAIQRELRKAKKNKDQAERR
jgi:hypothetical protein